MELSITADKGNGPLDIYGYKSLYSLLYHAYGSDYSLMHLHECPLTDITVYVNNAKYLPLIGGEKTQDYDELMHKLEMSQGCSDFAHARVVKINERRQFMLISISTHSGK